MFIKKNKLFLLIVIVIFFSNSNAKVHVLTLKNHAEFEQKVLNDKRPAVLKFWAPWCNPCTRVKKLIDEIAKKFKKEVNFVEINFDDFPELNNRYNIRSLPTLIFLDGKTKKEASLRQVGANISRAELTKKIKDAFKLKDKVKSN